MRRWVGRGSRYHPAVPVLAGRSAPYRTQGTAPRLLTEGVAGGCTAVPGTVAVAPSLSQLSDARSHRVRIRGGPARSRALGSLILTGPFQLQTARDSPPAERA